MRGSAYIFAAVVTMFVGQGIFTAYVHGAAVFSSDEKATSFWMASNALSRFFLALFANVHTRRSNLWVRMAVLCFLTFSLNDFIDELFFDPCKMQINEHIIIVALTWQSLTLIQNARKS